MATGIPLLTKLLDDGDLDPTDVQFLNARMLEDAGKYREALEMYKTILVKRKLEYGDLHFETVKTKYRMARITYLLRKYEEAFPMFEEVYSQMKVISGPQDENGLLARGFMANILRKTGKKALPIYEEIYEILSKNSPRKPFTLVTRINIALELCDQGKFDESIKILDEVCKIYMQMKSKSERIWSTMLKKSFVLCKQGKLSEALYINKFLHEDKKRVLGDKHPDTLMQLRCIGLILADQSEYDQAASAINTVLWEQVRYNDEIEINQNKWFLALILKRQGKLDESLSFFKKLYAMVKVKPSETITLLTAKLIVKILDQQGKYDEALSLYREVQEMDKPDSPDYSITAKNIKRITDEQGHSEKSGSSPSELYEIETKKFWEICEDCEKPVEE